MHMLEILFVWMGLGALILLSLHVNETHVNRSDWDDLSLSEMACVSLLFIFLWPLLPLALSPRNGE